MLKETWKWCLFLALLALVLLQGCEQKVKVDVTYKIIKDDIVFTLKTQKRVSYVFESSSTHWNKMGFYYGFRGDQKLRFPLKNLKAGEYSVTIRVFRNSRFRKLRGRTTLSVKVPVRVKLKFQQCETPRSPVWLLLTMKPGLKGSTRCHVRKDGKVVLRFKGTPGASLVVDGQTQVVKETGIARVEVSVLPLLMRSPLKAIAAPLPVRRSKKYRSSYVSISGFKSFFKRFTAVLTYKKKKLKHTISLESSPNCFKASARLVMRMMERGGNVPTNPGAKALFYFEGPYTIWTTDRTKTLGDVRFYAVRRYVGRRKIRTCRYNRSGRVPVYGMTHEIKVLGGKDVLTKIFKVRRASCPLTLMTRRGEKKEVVNSIPTWKVGRWLSRLRR